MATTWVDPERYRTVLSGDINPATGSVFKSGELISGQQIEYTPTDTTWSDPDGD